MIDFNYRVTLGPLDSKYIETLRGWRNLPEIWMWCRQYDLITDLDQERWYKYQAQSSDIRMYAIMAQKEIVGVAGFTSIDRVNRRAEFSLYIAPEHQGNRYGEKGLRTLIAHGFLNHGFNSIWGESFDGNPAIRTFEECGMKKEGTRRDFYFRNGKFIDAHLYSILSKEWSL